MPGANSMKGAKKQPKPRPRPAAARAPQRAAAEGRERAAPRTTIAVQGARVHNLKNVSLEIPRDRLIVITGLSGSGKSSLAFDTIYAEGQRRYMESLSSFAKRFVAQVAKPDVEFVFGRRAHTEPQPEPDPGGHPGAAGRGGSGAARPGLESLR